MLRDEIKNQISSLTKHNYVEIVSRGNTAIELALLLLPKNKFVLIPEEGGWFSYKTLPQKLNLSVEEVKCDAAKINLNDLKEKMKSRKFGAFLYQNPGGYFSDQPLKEIYEICKGKNCLVIMDVSGSMGTELCNGSYADMLVGSFGQWKLIEAKTGGFISCNNQELWKKISENLEPLTDSEKLKIISQKIKELNRRVEFLEEKRKKILKDLSPYDLVKPHNYGLVVVVRYKDEKEKEELVNYCRKEKLEYTECPRYIRLNEKALSIEVKRLVE